MSVNGKNPYIGPRTFLKEEGHLFFGREREARDLSALVISEKLVLFYAQSGAGKSSLINTRLIPDLENNLYEVLPVGRVSGDFPSGFQISNIYTYNLMRSLIQHEIKPDSIATSSLSHFLARLDSDEQGYFYDSNLPAEMPLTEGITPWRRGLIIDQFEELFSTHPEAWEKREDFFTQLAQAMEDDPYLWVVLVMREDYIAALDPYAHLLPGGLRVRYYMQRLGWEAALKAVQRPVENLRPYAMGVAEILVENLASIKVRRPDGTLDIQPGQYVEPVQLQVVCYGLWENLASAGSQITEDNLREVGDVNQSLEKFYDGRVAAVAKLKNIDERLIREWFNNELITGGIRNMVLQSQKKPNTGLDDDVIQALQGDLVRAEMRAGQIWYELSHDRLIEPVQASNAKWFAANLSVFQQQAALWVTQGRPDGLLLRGNELEQAKLEADSKPITKEERDFLAACISAYEREQREKRGNRLIRIMAIVAIIASIVAAGFAIWANDQSKAARSAQYAANTAEANAAYSLDRAEFANTEAASASGILKADRLASEARFALNRPDTISLGQLLAVEAYNVNLKAGETLPGVYQALFDSAAKGLDKTLQGGTVSHAAFGSGVNENWLILDNTLWNLTALQPVRLVETDQIVEVALRSDGQAVIVTGEPSYYSSEINVYVKDKANRLKDQILLAASGDGNITGVKLSEDGRWVATLYRTYTSSGSQGGVQLWDTMNLSSGPKFVSLRSTLDALAITRDGSKLAAVDSTDVLRIWETSGNNLQPVRETPLGRSFNSGTLIGKAGYGLQFSPDGHWLATMTNGEIIIWDSGNVSSQPIRVALETGDVVTGLMFSPDSNSLVYVTNRFEYCYYSFDADCKPGASLFRLMIGKQNSESIQPILENSDADITALDISKSGKLVIGNELGQIYALDLQDNLSDPFITIAHAGKIVNLAIGTDNESIVSSGETDGTRFWKLTEKKASAVIEYRLPGTIRYVSRATNGNELIVGGEYRKTNNPFIAIRVIGNLEDPLAINEMPLFSRVGTLQALSISEQWAAAGRVANPRYSDEESYFLDLWDLTTTDAATPSITVPLPAGVRSLAFSQDGSRIAAASLKNDLWVDSIENLKKQDQSEESESENELSALVPADIKSPFELVLPNGLTDIQSLLFAQHDEYLIGASANGVHVWNLNDLTVYELKNAMNPIQISPDQNWLVTANSENALNFYRIESISSLNEPPVTLKTGSTVIEFAFSSDGAWLAAATTAGNVLIYQLPLTSDSGPIYSLQGPSNTIWLEFTDNQSDQRWLVAGGGYYAYLWNLNRIEDNSGTTNDNPITLQGHRGNLAYAGFTKDSKWAMTVAADQTIRFWSMNPNELLVSACDYAGRNLTSTEWRLYIDSDPRKTCENVEDPVVEVQATPTEAPTQSSGTQVAIYATPTATSTPEYIFITYNVKEGDTLSLIAIKHSISIDTLIADNGITNPDLISLGQPLKIRTINTSVTP